MKLPLRYVGFIAAVGVAMSSASWVCALSGCGGGNLVVQGFAFALSNTVGGVFVIGAMWGLVVFGERVAVRSAPLAWAKGLTTVVAAGFLGVMLGLLYEAVFVKPLAPVGMPWPDPSRPGHFGYIVFWHSTLAAMLYVWWSFERRGRAAEVAANDAELTRLAAERSWDETRYQLLQAQIEPHFIFNSLANVRRLLHTDPAAADRLLDDLLRYFEHALPRLRDLRSTLGHEVELVQAYLAVHQVRMGKRLRACIDLPPELASLDLPPMLLLTLVENALKHGLQPLVEGGEIHVVARSAGEHLSLSVADTGAGMGSGHGGGSGLANTRARLKSLYGEAARLSLRVNEPRGVVATIDLPLGVPA
jgi:hypothetical protein